MSATASQTIGPFWHLLEDKTWADLTRFGAEGERGVVQRSDGRLEIVDVADVGEDALLVHDEARDDPGLAFALSRLSRGPYEPTPIGVFRAVERPEYGEEMSRQIVRAQEQRGADQERRRENRQDALRNHMNNFSPLRSWYSPPTNSA